ncbi:MAG: hypothetical protein ACXW2E_00535 [Nitrososphaeraceae archaeon]
MKDSRNHIVYAIKFPNQTIYFGKTTHQLITAAKLTIARAIDPNSNVIKTALGKAIGANPGWVNSYTIEQLGKFNTTDEAADFFNYMKQLSAGIGLTVLNTLNKKVKRRTFKQKGRIK